MNKDIEALKERIIALVDLENAIHEHSFDSGYETGYDEGWESGVEWINERGSYK